jgi:hypothetical protein
VQRPRLLRALGGAVSFIIPVYAIIIDLLTARNCSMKKMSPALALAMIFALQCAQGQDLHAMQTCTQLGDDEARLSCYDAAMGVAKSASSAAKPKPGDDGRLHSEAKTLPKTVSAQVREAALLPAGMYRLTLDNGQVWETTQADSALAFKANDAIVISRGWLGSIQISLAGHNTNVSATRKQ